MRYDPPMTTTTFILVLIFATAYALGASGNPVSPVAVRDVGGISQPGKGRPLDVQRWRGFQRTLLTIHYSIFTVSPEMSESNTPHTNGIWGYVGAVKDPQ